MNGSSNIDSINSAYLAIDESFSTTGGNASREDNEMGWEAIKTQRLTAVLRRKRLTGKTVGLSNDTSLSEYNGCTYA